MQDDQAAGQVTNELPSLDARDKVTEAEMSVEDEHDHDLIEYFHLVRVPLLERLGQLEDQNRGDPLGDEKDQLPNDWFTTQCRHRTCEHKAPEQEK